MDWIGVLSVLGYAALIVACLIVTFGLATARWSGSQAAWVAWAVAAISIFGGAVSAVIVTPDWSPITMLAAFVPSWFFGTWSASFARLIGHGASTSRARMKSLLNALLALVLAPVALLFAAYFWIPGLVASGALLYFKRPQRTSVAHPQS